MRRGVRDGRPPLRCPCANGDIFTLGLIRDRVTSVLEGANLTTINTLLGELQGVQITADLATASDAAAALRDAIAGLPPAH